MILPVCRCRCAQVLGRDPLHLAAKTGAVPLTREEIEGAWLGAFEKCPAI